MALPKLKLLCALLCLSGLTGGVLVAQVQHGAEEAEVRAAFERFWGNSWNWLHPEEIRQVIRFPFMEVDLPYALSRGEYSRVRSYRSAEELSHYINGLDGSAALDGRRPPARDVVVRWVGRSAAQVSYTATFSSGIAIPLVTVLCKDKDGWKVVFSALP